MRLHRVSTNVIISAAVPAMQGVFAEIRAPLELLQI